MPDALADHYISADMGAGSDAGRGIDDGGRVDARRIYRRGMKEPNGLREGEVRIRQPEGGRSDLRKLRRNQYRARPGGPGGGGVAGIRDKGELAGGRLFNACHAGDLGFAIAVESGAEMRSKIAKLHVPHGNRVLAVRGNLRLLARGNWGSLPLVACA